MQRFFCYIYQTDNYEKWYFYLHKALISKNIFFLNTAVDAEGNCHPAFQRRGLKEHPFQRDVHRLYFSLSGIQLSIKSLCLSIHCRTALVSVSRVSSMARIKELISVSDRWMFPKRAATNGCSLLNPFLAMEWICSASP